MIDGAEDEGNHARISKNVPSNRGYKTVNDLLKIYKTQIPQAAASTNPRKNPLLKSKGRIREDWSSIDGGSNYCGSAPQRHGWHG